MKLVLVVVASLVGAAVCVTPTVLYEWRALDFTWESEQQHAQWIATSGEKNCMPAGVKVSSDGDVFVSVPRWNENVPATLSKVVMKNGQPLLQPFPSWEMNEEGNSTALQSVLGFEIDPYDHIWVLDQGKVNSAAALPGAIKLVVWDIKTGAERLRYTFSEAEASLTDSFLNDIVLDLHNQFAYITDSGIPIDSSKPLLPALLVFDILSHTVRRVLQNHSSTQADPDLWITINGDKVLIDAPMETGADGIALSTDLNTLVWCPLTSHDFYSIPTSLLRDFTTSESTLESAVVYIGDKLSASDGLAFDDTGTLYLSSLEGSGINTWNGDVLSLVSDSSSMVWPDTLAFDHKGNMLFVSNQLHLFVQGLLDFSEGSINFRIWSFYTGTDSYLAAQ
ncbi:hypothetical protein Pelo_11399 [Pelomyxa schiedti]|nr:hypothetical protein Pelo_11399 [Pelomyxa schiedti]